MPRVADHYATHSRYQMRLSLQNVTAAVQKGTNRQTDRVGAPLTPRRCFTSWRQCDVRRLIFYELRRVAVLREIGLRNEKRAQKTEKAVLDVVEGEFSEAAE